MSRVSVYLAKAKETIRKVSDMLLDQVADMLHDHPEVLSVEVQGRARGRSAQAVGPLPWPGRP